MSEPKIGISEGIILAAVPAFGYWVAYLYELGFCHFFGIPSKFIEIGIPAVMAATLGVISVAAFLQISLDTVVFTLWSWAPPQIRPTLRNALLVTFVFGGFAVVGHWSLSTAALLFVLIVVPVLFGEWVMPVFTQRSIKGYLNKVEAAHKAYLAVNLPTDRLIKFGGVLFPFIFLGCYAVSLLSFFSGGLTARSERNFMVLAGSPERVVLKGYGQNFIAVAFDRKLHETLNDYIVVPINKDLGAFKVEKLGHLHPKE